MLWLVAKLVTTPAICMLCEQLVRRFTPGWLH